jgi:nucleoside-diphosphate-sugar epimerase
MGSLNKIALLGANGALGRALAPALSRRGLAHRVVGRTLLPLQIRFKGDGLAEIFVWETEPVKRNQPDTFVEQAVAGADTVVYLVGMPLWKFPEHLPLTARVLAAAKKAGVRRLLLVSSCWAYGAPQTERVTEDHPLAAPTAKGRIRREQEQQVLAAHTPGALETAVLRIGDFYGPLVEASYLWSPFAAVRTGKHAQLLSPADTPHDFVFVPDAAETIARFLEADAGWGQAWNLGGSGATTLRAMTEAIFAAAGQQPRYEVPPPWKLRVVAMMNPYVRELREMQYLLETPVLLDDSRLATLLNGLPKTSCAEGIGQTLRLRV